MPVDYDICVDNNRLFAAAGRWNALMQESATRTVFLTEQWLKAWYETKSAGVNVTVPCVVRDGELIAAAAFQERDGIIEFAGKGPSDYADFLLSNRLPADEARHCMALLLRTAAETTAGFRCFRLGRIPAASRTLRLLGESNGGFFATRVGSTPAPVMYMAVARQMAEKKSLRRHERGLARLGTLDCTTYTGAEEIQPLLPEFFSQHIKRWENSGTPSLFLREDNREFYRSLTRYFDPLHCLRFTVLRLDGRMVAAHFGFCYADSFIWYKPCYDTDLAKYSPGEVLLKRLIQEAAGEGVAELDFTIGGEAFKLRFASEVRDAVSIHVTDSLLQALLRRLWMTVKKAGGGVRR